MLNNDFDQLDRIILTAAATAPERCLFQRKSRGCRDWDKRNNRLEKAGFLVNLIRDADEDADATYVVSIWRISDEGMRALRGFNSAGETLSVNVPPRTRPGMRAAPSRGEAFPEKP